MTDMDRIPEELRRLVSALCDGELSAEEHARLQAMLIQDASAREFYRECMTMHGELAWSELARRGTTVAETGGRTAAHDAAAKNAIVNLLETGLDRATSFFSRSLVLSLLLTVVLPGTVLLLLVADALHQPVSRESAPSAVAKATKLRRCAWGKDGVAPAVGDELRAGDWLELERGLAELVFADGARVILRGPAAFQVGHRNRAYLGNGSLTARIPPSARGFTVDTPLASIVDLGTEFGLAVDAGKAVETHVFVGQVEVKAKAAPGARPAMVTRVSAGQAAQVRHGRAEEPLRTEMIAMIPERFVRRLPAERTEGLRESVVTFAHVGNRDPESEGWRRCRYLDKDATLEGVDFMPIDDSGTEAWAIDDRSPQASIYYRIDREQGLTRELIEEGKAQGWVVQARVKVIGQHAGKAGLLYFTYHDDQRAWLMRATVDREGRQCLLLPGKSSLGTNAVVAIPNSRGRYVDYEIRYRPSTRDADVYVDGQLVAIGYYATHTDKDCIQFGTVREETCEGRFASVTWGILPPTHETRAKQ